MIDQIQWILFSIPSILVASAVHEYAHAWSASLLGDNTAKAAGRMTLNPLAHVDPVGALMMVLAKLGWSKPVPINEANFENPVRGTAITAFAGPASNLLMSVIVAIPLRILLMTGATDINSLLTYYESSSGSLGLTEFAAMFLFVFMLVNISLAVFNLIPVPPLDGHKVVRAFLPAELRRRWEDLQKYGIWILLLLFLPFSPLSVITSTGLSYVMGALLSILLIWG